MCGRCDIRQSRGKIKSTAQQFPETKLREGGTDCNLK
jgi:hypothetical protein